MAPSPKWALSRFWRKNKNTKNIIKICIFIIKRNKNLHISKSGNITKKFEYFKKNLHISKNAHKFAYVKKCKDFFCDMQIFPNTQICRNA